MAVVSQKIPNLIGGVSQQPDSLKLPGQLRECDNYLPNPTFGLRKRPGTRAVGRLLNATDNGSFFSMFLDPENRFIVQIGRGGVVRVWDADSGVEQPVNTQSASSITYATHTDPSQIELVQINDFVFVFNRAVRAAQGTAVSASITPSAFVTINSITYDSQYTITLDGTPFNYTTPATGSLSLGGTRGAIVTLINADPNYTAVGVGNAIRIRRTNGAALTATATGGLNGTALEAFSGSVPSVAQLPRQYFNGEKIKVEVPGSGAPGYWLEFQVTNGSSQGAGVWVETVAPDTPTRFQPITMPHVLIQEANGTFTFRDFSVANAAATADSASVTGTVATVSVTNSGLASYAVGQSFAVSGGSGINLRLRVTRTRTDTTTTTSTLPSSTRVRWRVYADRVEYQWLVNGVEVARTDNTNPITLGNDTYSIGGAWVPVASPTPPVIQAFDAPLTTVTVKNGVIAQVEPSRIGRGYTAGNVVTDINGATFTIGSVQTVTQTVIPFAKQAWTGRKAGDLVSNPNPSFVDSNISGMSFYQNRLVIMSGDNVCCSKAGDFFNFYSDSAAQVVDSDPIDLSCGSREPVDLRFGISTNQGLYLFASNAQYIMGTNTDAFSPASAELNQISNYPETFRVGPVDTGSTFIFAEENDQATMMFEMAPGDSRQGRLRAVEITRLIPTYIPSDLVDLKVNQSNNLVAARSSRTPETVYIFRSFDNGNERLMASWFKWTFPAPVRALFFYKETVYVLMLVAASTTILARMNIQSDNASGAIRFLDKVYDVRLDLFDYTPTVTYNTVTDESTIRFKTGFYVPGQQPVVVSLDPFNPGNVEEPSVQQDDTGYFVVVPGDRRTTRQALGLKYTATALLPNFYLRQGENQADTINIPTINRIQIDSFESGPFRVLVNTVGRAPFDLEIPQRVANVTLANNIPMLRTGKNTFPVMARGDLTEISFIADSPFPTSMNSMVWEGTYSTKGIRVL